MGGGGGGGMNLIGRFFQFVHRAASHSTTFCGRVCVVKDLFYPCLYFIEFCSFQAAFA